MKNNMKSIFDMFKTCPADQLTPSVALKLSFLGDLETLEEVQKELVFLVPEALSAPVCSEYVRLLLDTIVKEIIFYFAEEESTKARVKFETHAKKVIYQELIKNLTPEDIEYAALKLKNMITNQDSMEQAEIPVFDKNKLN